MGSFKGHVLPGSLFLAVGLWHVWSAVVRYVSASPVEFRVRVWNPVGSGWLKHLELYVVAGGAFADMCVELLYSTHLKFFVGREGILNPAHMNDFEHGGMLLMFFLYGIVAILSEKTRFLPFSNGALCLIAAAAFCSEFLLFYFHSTSHQGLEGYYHLLLVILVGLCIFSTVAGAFCPNSFAVDLSSGVAISLQGLWFYQTAFTLYGPMMPRGCQLSGNDITCKSHDSEVRGEFIANIQLFSLVLLVFIFVLGCYSVSASKYGHSELQNWHAAALKEYEQNGGEELAAQ
ncbi:transmembrane protein 45A [Dioscorea cayenensis subsp. rotundata]|uniref:Transmembrane protein 45A n=1 Tax=Dioscorea cayennensis subsp. rotundata TaxID=55577 RepID=A0AB40B6G1_DIOCR|nr:transmembrane protein 45A [Dioscorea cayenensis subsp. rotundata]XP_039122910.1 transmembrane protein 45A [Dioscorea cayenensis subsp. rotundata]